MTQIEILWYFSKGEINGDLGIWVLWRGLSAWNYQRVYLPEESKGLEPLELISLELPARVFAKARQRAESFMGLAKSLLQSWAEAIPFIL